MPHFARQTGRYWTEAEHCLFLEALAIYPLHDQHQITHYINSRVNDSKRKKTLKQVSRHYRSFQLALRRGDPAARLAVVKQQLVCAETLDAEETAELEPSNDEDWPLVVVEVPNFCELLAVPSDPAWTLWPTSPLGVTDSFSEFN